MQKHPTRIHNPSQLNQSRRGVTLTEVLMSLMIMAIGVTSVISLFPIATLRSAQATKLTNAALLKYNVETLLQMRPELIFDPDGDGNLVEHYRGGAANRNYVVDPQGFFAIYQESQLRGTPTDSDNNLVASSFGYDITTNQGSPIQRFDGGIANAFGLALGPTTNLADDVRRALRITAQQVTELGDTWQTDYEFIPDTLVTTTGMPVNNDGSATAGLIGGVVIPLEVIGDAASATLVPTSLNLLPTTVAIPDPEWARMVVFSVDGQTSQTFPLLTINGSLVAVWSETLAGGDVNSNGHLETRALPNSFISDLAGYQVGRVLLQQKKSVDFSWLLTVRRTADGRVRSMDVVIKFGKETELEDERVYTATAGTTTSEILIDATLQPPIRRGGFVFDVGNARWHRIREYNEENGVVRVVFEKPASPVFAGPAMVIPSIVDVYPMGSQSIPDSVLRGF